MSRYRYLVVDANGQYHKGVLEATTYEHAMEELRTDGYWIIELFDLSKSWLRREVVIKKPKVKMEPFTVFCRQLATLYQAGVGMVEAIHILSQQTTSKYFSKVLQEVSEEMRQGTQLSAATAMHPDVFGNVFVNMVRAGEASGNLDDMLSRLATFYEKEHYTREKVKSAMIYPIIMGVVSIVVVTFMMIFVIPKYVANFAAMNVELPLPTKVVIGLSEFIQSFWYLVILLLLVPSLLKWIISRSEKLSYWLDHYKLKFPVFGKLWHKQAIARFSRTFSSLFSAAIPILQIMSITSKVVDNRAISKLILDSQERLRGGGSIAEPFRDHWLFPPMVVQMLIIGERTGELDSMMEKMADFYETDVDTMTDRLKSMLEPIMILLLTVVVGGIVVAVLMPTFTLFENM